MKNYHEDMRELVDRYLKGECTEDEARMVNSYFNKIASEAPNVEPIKSIAKRKRKVWNKITGAGSRNTNRTVFRYLSVAAAIAVFFGGWWLMVVFPIKESSQQVEQQSDIAPGSYGATLMLKDGTTVALDSTKQGAVIGAELAYEDGSAVRGLEGFSPDELVDIVATTTNGQTYSFTLPDGTKVWLNAASRLTFPASFRQNERRVRLEGEAYFVVQHDAENPFYVESNGQLVEDLGTAFNMKAYPGELDMKTTLVEGTVKVNGRALVPGQQSILTQDGRLQVKEVDIDQVIAWQHGDFVFRGETLEEVLRTVARWYAVEVRYERDAAKRITVGGTISRSRSIRAVLDLMESTGKVHFDVSGKMITVR